MIQNIIKKMLRKWLKKKLYVARDLVATNVTRFEWVYNSPLHEWRDRIWVVKHSDRNSQLDLILEKYLH